MKKNDDMYFLCPISEHGHREAFVKCAVKLRLSGEKTFWVRTAKMRYTSLIFAPRRKELHKTL